MDQLESRYLFLFQFPRFQLQVKFCGVNIIKLKERLCAIPIILNTWNISETIGDAR